MPLTISDILAREGIEPPPVVPADAGAAPAAGAPPAAGTPAPAAANQGLLGNPKLMALLQAFGGLKAPQQNIPDPIRAPQPVAPTQANAGAIVNTGPTSAIASLLAAGMRPGGVPSLGQFILPQR